MKNLSKIFTEKDIFNLCYSVHLTGLIDFNTFPSNDLEERYYNLSIHERERLDKIIDKIIKCHKKDFKYLESISKQNHTETLHLLQKKLLNKVILDFKLLCNYRSN